MDITSIIQSYYVPIIVIACLCIGYVIKKIDKIPDKYIPLIMFILGGTFGAIVNGVTFEGIVFGAVSGVASTGMHQLFKQIIEGQYIAE